MRPCVLKNALPIEIPPADVDQPLSSPVGQRRKAFDLRREVVSVRLHRVDIHVCVQDGSAARRALEGAGIKVEGESDAILTEPFPGADKPGSMGMMARKIADAGINVRVIYVATGSRGIIVTDDNAKAMSLMTS